METEPSFITRIFDFGRALLQYWWLIVTGVVFAVEPMVETFVPKSCIGQIDHWWPKEKRPKHFQLASILALLIASFLVFDDVSTRNRVLKEEASKANGALYEARRHRDTNVSPLDRKIADDLITRIRAAGPDFVNRFSGITGIVYVAFTCGSGAQQFADDFVQIMQLAGVNASRLFSCVVNKEIETSRLYMTVPDPNNMTDSAKTFFRIIQDSLIPIAPHPIKDFDLFDLKDRPQSIGFIYVGE